MGRFKTLTGIALGAILLMVFNIGIANAVQFQTGPNVAINQDGAVEDTIFAAGRTVDINTEVNGDVFCAGQTITISGIINGDVICAGQTVNVTGEVNSDVRLAGQTVTIGAVVTGNATIGGQSFNLESTGTIEGDLSIGASDAFVNGKVGRDVIAGSTNHNLAGEVGRNVKAGTENLTIASTASVQGDVAYTSNNEANVSDQASIGGTITKSDPPKSEGSKNLALFEFGMAWLIYLLLAMMLTAIALVLLFPQTFHRVSGRALPKPWKALLVGFLASIVAPLMLLLVAITVVGLPLAILFGMAWLIVLFLSGPVFGYYIGRLVLKNSDNAILYMLVGSAILLVLYVIPIIGFIVLLAAAWIGTGMILLDLQEKFPKPNYKVKK